MMDKIYKVDEVAERLGCHIETVRRKIRSGQIRAIKIGNDYRISESELDRYLKEGDK